VIKIIQLDKFENLNKRFIRLTGTIQSKKLVDFTFLANVMTLMYGV
jgi:hypothetical protein